MSDMKELQNIIRKFNSDREWEKFHKIKNLVMALNVESSELLEIFQWMETEDAEKIKENNEKFEHVKEEMADILCYLLNIADKLNIDMFEATKSKIIKNGLKYPIETSKGTSKKYNEK